MILFTIVIIGLVIYLSHNESFAHGCHQNMPKDSLAILKERYAKGEITTEQFISMKENLLK